jgi:hypothetical protein
MQNSAPVHLMALAGGGGPDAKPGGQTLDKPFCRYEVGEIYFVETDVPLP